MTDHRSSRRGVLKVLTAGLGAALAALVTVPGLGMLLRPRHGAGGSAPPWIPVASLRSLGEGEPRLAQIVGPRRDAWSREDAVALGACWLVRAGAGVRAFASACPHLGCAVTWDAAAARFECPCHASTFAGDGRVLGGPAPRGLDELEVGVEGDRVSVRWRARGGSPS